MTPLETSRRKVITGSAASGLMWAGLALLLMMVADLRTQELGRVAWGVRGGILAAPLIGIAVGLLGWRFRNTWVGARILIALLTLYLASFLFWLAAGLLSWISGGPRHPPGSELISGSLVATVASLTFTGFVTFLWPLAYVNHSLISRIGTRSHEGDGLH